MSDAPKKMSKKETAAAEAAAKMAERQKNAENAFSKADKDGSGAVDGSELKMLLWGLLQQEGFKCEVSVVDEFVAKEFTLADTDGSGDVDFEEFIEYYNALVDRLTEGALATAIDDAKKAAAKKAEDAAIAEDDGVYVALHTLLTVLRQPSVGTYCGFSIPFKIKDNSEYATPNPEHGASSRGLVLDLSRRAQRLLTPWGSFPIGYRLAFPNYQEKKAPAEEEDEKTKRRPKKPSTPFPLIPPSSDGETEASPLFFGLAKLRLDADCIVVLRKTPLRCHFQVVEILGVKQPKGEVLAPTEDETIKKLKERWQAQLKKNMKDPKPELLGVTPQQAARCLDDPEKLVVNEVLKENGKVDRHVAVNKEKMEILRKKKEVAGRAANKRFPEEDLDLAMKMKLNDPSAAATMLLEMGRCENNTLDKRTGHSTRMQVREALQTTEFDEEAALWYLKNRDPPDADVKQTTRNVKVMNAKYDYISQRLGTASGLGYPTRMEVERLLVTHRGEEGKVMAALKREWKLNIDMMVEILAAAEVEEMLTPEMCDAFGFSKPVSADEAKHVEDLYLSDEFGRDKEKLTHFLTESGTVLRRKAGDKPPREMVVALLRKMNTESDRVLAFLASLDTMFDAAPKAAELQRTDVARYLTSYDYDEANATELMKTIWKLANPKPPKPPPKGSKKPPQPYYSEMCGFPSIAECEWALLGTRKANDAGKPLVLDKALELLQRLDSIHTEVKLGSYPKLVREDIIWVLDPLTKRVDLSLKRDAPQLLQGISDLLVAGDANGVKTGRKELLEAYEKFAFDKNRTESYLNAIGTLMRRQLELSVVSREEVEQALEANGLDDVKVIELFEAIAKLQAMRDEIGNASREEIKAMLGLAWDDPDRTAVTKASLATYRTLISNDEQLMSLFGNGVGEPEREYLRISILRFKGESEASLGYLKKVSEILGKGEALGWPSREYVVEELDKAGLDGRKATQAIRQEYQTRRDLELKEEYAKKRAAQPAGGQPAGG